MINRILRRRWFLFCGAAALLVTALTFGTVLAGGGHRGGQDEVLDRVAAELGITRQALDGAFEAAYDR